MAFNKKILNAYVYFVIFLIIFSSSSIYIIINPEFGNYLKIIVMGLCLVPLLIFCRSSIPLKYCIYTFLIIILFLLNILLFQVNAYKVLMVCLRFITILIFSVTLMKNGINLLDKIFKILFILAVAYLLMYVVFEIGILGISGERIVITTYSGVSQGEYSQTIVSYLNVFYRTQTISVFDNLFNRFNGFCWEAGAYQFFLNICLIGILFNDKKISIWKFLIIIISIMLTFSTMGYICMFIIITARVLKSKNVFLSILSFFLAGIFVALTVVLLEEKARSISYSSRTEDFSVVLNLILESPIFGYGYGEGAYSYSGMLTMFTHFGLLAIIFIVPMFFAVYKNDRFGKIGFLTFGICIILGFVNEPFEYTNFMFLLVGIGLNNIINRNQNEVNVCQNSFLEPQMRDSIM